MRHLTALPALAATLLLAACEEPEVDGAAFFADNCTQCHGPAGRGDGPLAEGLGTPPADLTRISARNGGEFPLVHVMSVIDGYARGDRAMPAFGAADLGDTIVVEIEEGVGTPVPSMLWALAGYLESIQEP
ncbi:c-type cytochrome [Wenxinia marina]|uniref:Cytochrome C oxidase, cbb3-type, subunit III n=1 Tax=Wenxinia marina DSM 24838 TaxID=1123501 RepID=A0A0D0Q7L6_9RHOB|nr:c-type cytochrome [Wenxinia marina]KIQ68457.1 Cytochrome C oxidase, cbb3-type, subunit III [Wenxinia marina DSM 24838]GGL65928.1 cytochrome c [Wenxinia marina]